MRGVADASSMRRLYPRALERARTGRGNGPGRSPANRQCPTAAMRGHSSTELNSRLSRRALRRRTVFRPTPRARFCRRASAFRASRSESRAVTRTEVSVCTTRHRPSGRQRKPLGVPFSLLTDIVLPPAVALVSAAAGSDSEQASETPGAGLEARTRPPRGPRAPRIALPEPDSGPSAHRRSASAYLTRKMSASTASARLEAARNRCSQ